MSRNHRRTQSAEALRWSFGLVVTAILASAVTSAVFLSVRTAKQAPPPSDDELAHAKQQWASLAPALEAFARERADQAPSPTTVDVTYRVNANPPEDPVPMVAPEDHALMLGNATPWLLEIDSRSQQRQFKRILDIRRSTSLRHPGYFAVVEFEEIHAQRHHELAGTLPFQPPKGYRVISTAEYTELQESEDFNVELDHVI